MTTLRVCVQKQRSDGYYPVYIRVIHGRQSGFIKTDKMVDRKSVTKTREIRDNMVLKYCTELISEYNAKLNMQDTSQWSVKEIISFLTTDQSDASFSEYAKLHINRMINSGHERNAKNYKLAVASLEQYMGTNKIMFSYLTSVTLKKWIDHLAKKMRAKEMYPVCVRQIFKAALVELNDEERGVIRIKFNPWLKVQIPKSDKAEQRAISAEACREFFNRPLPQTKMISSLPELGRDVAKLVLCLGGINTVDLFYMKKSNYKNGVIGYNRAKTRHSRSDEAYIEMRVEPFIQPVFDKYLADDDDEFLFNFHLRYCDSDSFSANVNNGIRKICKDMGMKKEDYYCVYTFRHTWGTIAQNDCEANLFEVAFGMNHSSGFKVTRGYVRIDFSPAWELNAKIIEFIFFSNKESKQGKAQDLEQSGDKLFRISKKMMIHGRAYFKGAVIAELTDIGFSTVNSVIACREFAVLAPIAAHEIKLLVRKIRKILTDIFNAKDSYILIFTLLINGAIQERISTLEVGYFSGGLWADVAMFSSEIFDVNVEDAFYIIASAVGKSVTRSYREEPQIEQLVERGSECDSFNVE